MGQIKDIQHPVWEQRLEQWLNHIPADLQGFPLTVSDMIANQGIKIADKLEFELVASLREKTLSDAIFLRDKARYCFNSCEILNNGGFPTSTALSMYDAAFFAAKSLIFVMGIRDYSRDSSYYIELFVSRQKRGKVIFDGHHALSLKTRMTHDMLWKIFTRILDTLKGNAAEVEVAKAFKKNDFDKFSKERNRLLYECGTWSRQDDIDKSDLRHPVSYHENIQYLSSDGEIHAEYYSKYYVVAHVTLNIVDIFLAQLGRLRLPFRRT